VQYNDALVAFSVPCLQEYLIQRAIVPVRRSLAELSSSLNLLRLLGRSELLRSRTRLDSAMALYRDGRVLLARSAYGWLLLAEPETRFQ
jgi:hypothetical protein